MDNDTTQQSGNDTTQQTGNGTTRQSGNGPHKLAIIVGSVREGRFGPTVASWVAEQARSHGGFDVDVIDLAGIDIPLALPAESPKFAGDSYPRPAGMARLTEALESADAFIVVTPEYNHSYPASLKAAIDWHFTQWTAKPVAFVSYGGAAGGRHAVLHLENVLTELHAVTIRDGLAFPNYFTAWRDGRPLDEAAEGYAKTLLDQLSWWAGALSAAREAQPYPV
ncbi:NADPH-dependent FMN reductase [Streptomyces sp. NPDC014806]|uniref:NADPH-dependent FMN reductase n=1 Tax=Streptomyces sp. NPDC014806 TaxID=3364920 RepID=UPI0036FE6F3C